MSPRSKKASQLKQLEADLKRNAGRVNGFEFLMKVALNRSIPALPDIRVIVSEQESLILSDGGFYVNWPKLRSVSINEIMDAVKRGVWSERAIRSMNSTIRRFFRRLARIAPELAQQGPVHFVFADPRIGEGEKATPTYVF